MRYLVFYDGTCALCRRSKTWLERRDPRGAFEFVDSRDPTAMAAHPAVSREEAQGRMIVVTPGGDKRCGYDGIVTLTAELAGWRRVRRLLELPGLRHVGRYAYRSLARNRYRLFGNADCQPGVCRV